MLRVATVSTVLPETNACADLTIALQSMKGVHVRCLADKTPQNRGVPINDLVLAWDRDYRYPFQVAAEVLRYRPHLVHVHHEFTMYGSPVTALLFPLLMTLLKSTGAKVIVTIHAVVPLDLLNRDFIATFNPDLHIPLPLARLGFSYIYRAIGLLADAIIVHSPCLALTLVNDYYVQGGKIHAIPHGTRVPPEVRNSTPPSAPWTGRLRGRKVILNFGYLAARKGLPTLIRAFARVAPRHPDWDLVVAGGTLQPQYERQLLSEVRRLGLTDRILFTAFVTGSELDYLFRRSDIVALPAMYSISASGPLSLAIGYLKPVVANRIGVFAEDLSHGEDSLLSEPGNSAAMASNLESLIADPSLRDRLAAGMRQRRRTRAWICVARHTAGVYHHVARS